MIYIGPDPCPRCGSYQCNGNCRFNTITDAELEALRKALAAARGKKRRWAHQTM